MSLASLIKKVAHPVHNSKKHEYVFLETMGAGGFGIVRKAENKKTHADVAIKIMLKSKIKESQEKQGVSEELKTLEGLHHPHIVELIDWFESRDKIYVVTELCTGGELFDRICEQGHFTEENAAKCIREVATAIQYIHARNIIHRDIKPENLLYATKDPKSPLKLCDFGVAKSLVASEDLITNAAGSLGYAAPEVFHSEQGHGKPCDIWSLGVVLFTVLSGYSPFQAETVPAFLFEVQEPFQIQFLPQYWDHISNEAKDLVRKMVALDPKDRLTIDEVLAHPWLSKPVDSKVNLLPKIKPGLSARQRWRVAFERIRLAQRVKLLGMDTEDEEDEQDERGNRFMDIVAQMQRQSLQEKAEAAKADLDTPSSKEPAKEPEIPAHVPSHEEPQLL